MSSDAIQIRDAMPNYGSDAAAQDVPPGYKCTDVGVIPEDWGTYTLNSLGSGGIPPIKAGPFGSSLTKATYVSDGYKVYGQEQVIRGDHSYGDYFITRTKYLELESCAVRAGDVLLSLVGTAGKLLVIPECAPPGIINPRLIRFSFDRSRVDSQFFRFLFESDQVQAKLARQAQGGTMGVLNASNLRSFHIQLPLLHEQRAIAEALSDVDGLLGALEALIAKKRAIKQAAIQQLLTGKTRLPGFSGEWETKRLGDHVRFLRHGNHSRADLSNDAPVRYLHYGDIHTSTEVFLNPGKMPMPRLRADSAANLDRLVDGDLILVDASEDLDGVGKSVEVAGAECHEVVSGLHTIAARFDKTVLADGFKAYLQFCPTFRQHLTRLAAGTKVYATNRSHIASTQIPLPTTAEQTAIATVLSDIDAEIAALEARRDKTRAIKQGMMQQLLTGRVRLVKPKADADAD